MYKPWITADWHLGESRFELMGRPFKTVKEHIDCIVENHNAVVGVDDFVIVNGDVCYQKAPEYLPCVKWMNGRKILIRGNHDRGFTDEQLKPYFEQIVPEGEGIEINAESLEPGGIVVPCYVTHYPTCGRTDRFNLTGHIHAAWKYQLNMLNVGVDVNHFSPVAISRVPFHFTAIKEFYDRDVWVADNPINAYFKDVRGKKTRYLDAK